jgi:hypothetical protein
MFMDRPIPAQLSHLQELIAMGDPIMLLQEHTGVLER